MTKYKVDNFNNEIEFLRAISVILVLFFHFELFFFKGGFIGVDVFFVISGYLITLIILKNDNFEFGKFYLKRLRRLFPIILLVTISTLIVGLVIFSPIHFERLTRSSASAILGISNFFFFSEKGYFDLEKLFKPLLHTWSLSVELQFYLIWPIILVFLKKFFNKKIFYGALLILITSIVLSSLYSFRSDSFFYFTGFRFYEFMIGAMIVFYNNKFKKITNNFLILMGFFLIILSSVLFDESYNFPNYFAAIPCFGAALVILSSRSKHDFNFLIRNKYLRSLGEISYTVYMIHWPVLIFYKYQIIDELFFAEKIIIIICVIIVSFFISKFFEKPFRDKNIKSSSHKNFYLLLLFLTTIIMAFSLNIYSKSEKNYFNKKIFVKSKVIDNVFEGREIKNKIEKDILQRNKEYLYFTNKNFGKKILIIGDSHAFDFYLALRNVEQYKGNYQFDYMVFDYLYCFKNKSKKDKIIEFINYKLLNRKNSCKIVLENINLKILNKVEKVIISSRWPDNINYNYIINFFGNHNKNLILIGNGQRFYDVPTLFFKKKNSINEFLKNVNKKLTQENDFIKKKAIENKIKFFDKSKLNCDPDCVAFEKNILLYSDKDHWAFYGLDYFSKKIFDYKFEKLLE